VNPAAIALLQGAGMGGAAYLVFLVARNTAEGFIAFARGFYLARRHMMPDTMQRKIDEDLHVPHGPQLAAPVLPYVAVDPFEVAERREFWKRAFLADLGGTAQRKDVTDEDACRAAVSAQTAVDLFEHFRDMDRGRERAGDGSGELAGLPIAHAHAFGLRVRASRRLAADAVHGARGTARTHSDREAVWVPRLLLGSLRDAQGEARRTAAPRSRAAPDRPVSDEWERWADVPPDCVPLVVFEVASIAARRARREVEEAVGSLERARVRFEEMQTRHRRKLEALRRWNGLAEEAGREAIRHAEARAAERRREAWRDERAREARGELQEE
jgi:hypothetical protein